MAKNTKTKPTVNKSRRKVDAHTDAWIQTGDVDISVNVNLTIGILLVVAVGASVAILLALGLTPRG